VLREVVLRPCLLDSLCSLSDVKLSGPGLISSPRLSAAVSSKDEGNVERVFNGHRPSLEIDQSKSRRR